MIALMFLIAIAVWLVVVTVLTIFIPRIVKQGWLRIVVRLILFPALLVAPIADEWIAGEQFKALCEKDAVLYLSPDWRNVKNAKEILTRISPKRYVVDVHEFRYDYIDTRTEKIFFSFTLINREGGFLVKKISWSTPPRYFCGPGNLHEVYQMVDHDGLLKKEK